MPLRQRLEISEDGLITRQDAGRSFFGDGCGNDDNDAYAAVDVDGRVVKFVSCHHPDVDCFGGSLNTVYVMGSSGERRFECWPELSTRVKSDILKAVARFNEIYDVDGTTVYTLSENDFTGRKRFTLRKLLTPNLAVTARGLRLSNGVLDDGQWAIQDATLCTNAGALCPYVNCVITGYGFDGIDRHVAINCLYANGLEPYFNFRMAEPTRIALPYKRSIVYDAKTMKGILFGKYGTELGSMSENREGYPLKELLDEATRMKGYDEDAG
jgi:hypothetical protein